MIFKIFIKLKKYVLVWRIFLLDIIFPIECISCSNEGVWICKNCYEKISIKQTQECPICTKNNFAGNFCKKCRNEYSLNGVLVAADYQNKLLSRAIKIYKYKLIKDLATPLSQLLIDLLHLISKDFEKNYFWRTADNKIIKNFSSNLIIPVPLFWKRQRWRGFNQSEELAKKFAEHFKLEIDFQNLKRIKFHKAQTRLEKNERFKNIKNNFIWNGKNLKNKNIILIDDVSTSTATLNECAKILKKNGAGKVWGLVIGHG